MSLDHRKSHDQCSVLSLLKVGVETYNSFSSDVCIFSDFYFLGRLLLTNKRVQEDTGSKFHIYEI